MSQFNVTGVCGSRKVKISAVGRSLSSVDVSRIKKRQDDLPASIPPGSIAHTGRGSTDLTDSNAICGHTYRYNIPGVGDTDDWWIACCTAFAGQFIIKSSSNDLDEYQLAAPRYAAVNEYTLRKASILDEGWLHAYTLPPPDDDTQGQAIGVWLFQSSPKILSVIARERSSQGDDSDFLAGYEIILNRTLEEREEEDLGETAKEGDAEVIVEEVVEKVEVKHVNHGCQVALVQFP